jgi:iron complex transport system substrate-binding protein
MSRIGMLGNRIRSTATATGATLLACVLSSCGSTGIQPLEPRSATSAQARAGHPEAPKCPPAPVLSSSSRRIVTMDGGAAAILTELGVGDRIVGTASPDFFDAFAEPQISQLHRIPVIDPKYGSAEAVINAKPELVVGVSVYSFGGFDGTATVDQLHHAGAQVLVACRSSSRPGPVKDLSVTTTFIDEAAKLLNVNERGDELNRRISSEIDRARPIPGTQPVRVLLLSDAPVDGQPMVTLGGRSLANGVIALAGGQNIASDIDADFTSLSYEAVIARDPQAIVVATGFAAAGDRELMKSIRDSPVLAGTTAVRQGRLVTVPQSILLSPSVLNGAAVAVIAQALREPAT